MADSTEKNETPNGDANSVQDFGVEGSNPEIARRAERLREAVERAGGPKIVAEKAGMALGTLNNYRNGRDMKADALVRLARATGAKLEWLATGDGLPDFDLRVTNPGMEEALRRERESAPAGGTVQPPDPAASLSATAKKRNELASMLDMTRMGEALKAAAEIYQGRGVTPTWRRLVQMAALLYDADNDPIDTVRAMSDEISEG